jgi:hypothetical protein
MHTRSRPKIPIPQQVEVFFRDGWLCRWCGMPVVFAPALNALQEFVEMQGHPLAVAYFHRRWTRRDAPLLDHLGVVPDHIDAFVRGGATETSNLAVACCKCNSRKSDAVAGTHAAKYPKHKITGRYGEPVAWDGLAAVFVALARQHPEALTSTDRQWLIALQNFYDQLAPQGGGNGRQPSSSETNRTPAAAASRPSP